MAIGNRATTFMLIAIGACITIVAVAGIWSARASVRELDRQNKQADCVQVIYAKATETFQHDIGVLLDAYGRHDSVTAARAIDRIKQARHAAEIVNDVCPSRVAVPTTGGK